MKEYLTIGEVSKITSLPISTLRYYDNEGIISPNYKDENTNYRYYRFFQIPIIKMIVHLKNLGFSKSEIKSHLENLSYSHTLELMNKMIEQTQGEIERLKKLEEELRENAQQMKYLIALENKLDEFFIEEKEITGIYAKVTSAIGCGGISKAFKELDSFLVKNKQDLVPVGMFAFTITQKDIENRSFNYDRLILLRDFENYDKRCHYPKKKYACMVCQSKFLEMGKNVEKILEWIESRGEKIDGDTIAHILSGPAFEKDPSDVMYILRVPIKI